MLRISGGKVYDPANGVHGEVRDVCVAGGRVVADVQGGRTLAATGMVVFPGGVDVHTHVAGAALNFARGLIPEQHRVANPVVRNAVNFPSLSPGEFEKLGPWIRLAEHLGAVVSQMGAARVEAISVRYYGALADSRAVDVLGSCAAAGVLRPVLSGGVSAGDWDLVIPALEAEGVKIAMHQVAIKPGKPFCFAPGGFGLPGFGIGATG